MAGTNSQTGKYIICPNFERIQKGYCCPATGKRGKTIDEFNRIACSQDFEACARALATFKRPHVIVSAYESELAKRQI